MESSISLHALASAVGIGLLIGAVRERAEQDPANSIAGVRTHLLVALAGTLGAALGTAVLVAVLLLLGALIVVGYLRNGGGPGITGEVAVPVTALLAAMALKYPLFATGVAVIVATVLYAKAPLHDLVRVRLSEAELRAGLLLAGAIIVVEPLLPDQPIDPWGVLVPSKLWRLVVLILAVGVVVHVALRVVGARWGLPLAGFLSGFASSTAAVAGFGQRARSEPTHLAAAASGALFANLGSYVLFIGVAAAGAPTLVARSAWPLAAGGVVLAAFALAGVLRRGALDDLPGEGKTRVFQLTHALVLTAVMALMLVAAALVREKFGSAGGLAAAAAGAAVELHAAVASLSQLFSQQALSMAEAQWGLVLLMLVAAVAKSGLAFVSGGPRFGWRVATGLLMSPAAMALVQGLWQAAHAG